MLYGLPHAALGPELTLDYHERSSLFSWREGFALVGTLVAAVVPGILIKLFGDERRAFAEMAIAYGILMVSLYWLLVARVRERPEFVRRKSNPLVPGVRRSLRNRPFVVLFTCYVVASIPGAIPGLMMPYFSRYVLNPPPLPAGDAQSWLSIFLATYFLSGLLCLPLWLALAKRIGKLNAWLTSFLMGVTGGFALFLLGPGDLRRSRRTSSTTMNCTAENDVRRSICRCGDWCRSSSSFRARRCRWRCSRGSAINRTFRNRRTSCSRSG
jgi:GPH family glycoside/pentoside/hexuronide:cation symporter